MRLAFAGVVLGALLGGCGEATPPLSEAHVSLAKTCVADGGEAAVCECEATKIDELVTQGLVSKDVQQALVLQSEGKETEANEIMLKLPPSDLLHQPSLIAEARLKCHAPG